jgi:hypothetical protein
MISSLNGHNKGLPIFTCFDVEAWKVVPEEYALIPQLGEMFEDHCLPKFLKLAFAAMFLHVGSPVSDLRPSAHKVTSRRSMRTKMYST